MLVKKSSRTSWTSSFLTGNFAKSAMLHSSAPLHHGKSIIFLRGKVPTPSNSTFHSSWKVTTLCTRNRGEGWVRTVREVQIIDMLITIFLMIIISTSLTVPTQPSPRFHVEAWLPFRNCEKDYLYFNMSPTRFAFCSSSCLDKFNFHSNVQK